MAWAAPWGIPMAPVISMSTPDPLAILSLMQWLSPAFPTGGFAWSHGLEQAVAAGEVRTGADVAVWLDDILTHGAGWSDAVLLAAALRPGADLAGLAATARALCTSAERLGETMEQGAAFAAARAAMTGAAVAPHPLPLAFAQAARGLPLPAEVLIAAYLHAFAANLVSAAVRFVPLGQAEGQRILAARHERIAALAARAAGATLADLRTAAFRADLAAMQHETLDVRIFRS